MRLQTKNTLTVYFAFVSLLVFTGQPASATITDNGNILSDTMMNNSSSMSATEIQNFFNSKIPSCVTSVCLNNFTENNQSAASIISNKSTAYHLNPQVIISLIQAKTALVTNNSPGTPLLSNALGFPEVTGFTNQVEAAARFLSNSMKGIVQSPSAPYVVGVYDLPWSSNPACGSAPVSIKNLATATLYSYPNNAYQPNAESINAGYGQGNDCSSYAIRNIHNYLRDWFTTTATNTPPSPQTRPLYRFYSPVVRHHFYTADSYEKDQIIANFPPAIWTYESVAFQVKAGSNCGVNDSVYRLYSETLRTHLYTMDSYERDQIVAHFPPSVWRYEGVAFCADSAHVAGTKPVYRFYSDLLRSHLYTVDENEKNVLIATYPPSVWRYEGVAWYAY